MNKKLYTISEVAEILRVKPLTLKRWEKSGHIKPIRLSDPQRTRRYTQEMIDKMLNNPTTQPQTPTFQ